MQWMWVSRAYPSVGELFFGTYMAASDLELVESCACILQDEAAQGTEPETIVPWHPAGRETRLILIGDPDQLRPCCTSDIAFEHGLRRSLLERWMDIPGIDHVKLVVQYRMHPSISFFPYRNITMVKLPMAHLHKVVGLFWVYLQ